MIFLLKGKTSAREPSIPFPYPSSQRNITITITITRSRPEAELSMFYEGDLQSGIGRAVDEAKLVACFVTDQGQESLSWENDFLEDPTLKTALSSQTILLRLEAGSQEASYLAAIFPVPKSPTLVVIHNGQLKEYLTSGTSKEEFLRRMSVVLQPTQGGTTAASPQAAPISGEQMDRNIQTSPEHPVTAAGAQTNASASTPLDTSGSNAETPAATEQARSTEIQNLLEERRARLEAHKKEQEAKEKADRSAKAKARRQATDEAAGTDATKKSADLKYAMMQKKRQQEAKEERARILKRVEDDKAERREREALRKAQAQAQAQAKETTVDQAPSSILKSPPGESSAVDCALQIRLFDGSTIRSRFPSSASLRADVRPWIDNKQELDVPYTFKHVLTPLPNKNISISDEEQNLQSLELAPSATLILVPVKGYTSAYENSNVGIVSRGLSAGFGLVSSALGMITGAFGGLVGGGAAPATPGGERQDISTPGPPPTINVRTLRDQDERQEDHQLYNGNALNFEPRKDDDDDSKKD